MEDRQEIIEFPQDLHTKVFLHKIGIVTRHWHRSLELLFVLEGQAHVGTDEQIFLLSEGDIILINSNSIHELYSKEGAVLIALQLKPELFRFSDIPFDRMEFACNSSTDPDSGRYDSLRWAIARMVLNNISRHPGTNYLNAGVCYYLLAELVTCFLVENGDRSLERRKHTQRLSEILDYIEAHYKEDIRLIDLAKSQQLSVPYLSGFFSQYMGIKFTRYYTDVKLNHAVSDLLGTDHTIERVALDNGFQDVHSFIRSFKAKFSVTPNVYRKKNLERQLSQNESNGINYLSIEASNYLRPLMKYLHENFPDPTASTAAVSPVKHLRASAVNTEKVQRRLTHNFRNVMTVGRARDLLNSDIREMLRDIQSTVGFKFIKFHGILSDDMMVCSALPDGTLQFCYRMVDAALDFLLSVGLRPVVQLSFMPAALASDPNKTVFFHPFNTSPPKDMSEWNRLVADFTRHLISRYGRGEVASWPFCVWCEPETSTKMFGFGNHALFCEFYKNTYDTVKSVCSDIRFGSPAFLCMRRHGESAFLTRFLDYTLSHGCRPDFMNIHYYADIIPREAVDMNVSNALSSRLPKETDDFSRFITEIRALFGRHGVGDLPVYLTEWNLTLSHRNLISDTCFKSCYILKNLLENYDRLDSFGYWSLTDLLEENPLPESGNVFHGGLGLYTMNGTRKSVFYAFDFANRLGDELLAQGEGYFVTRKNGRIQVITYNYVHYGGFFAAGDAVGITATERYAPFDMSRRVSFSIPLTGLSAGQYIVREYYVNRESGSAFDLWVKAGGLPLSSADTRLFQNRCVPGLRARLADCENGSLHYSPVLEPLEIRFAEISPAND